MNLDTIRVFETDFGLLHVDEELRITNLDQIQESYRAMAKEAFYAWVNRVLGEHPKPKRSWWGRPWWNE